MALFAIPNPKKATQIDFSIERVKLSVLNISLVNDKYKFTSANEIFNQYTYEALEFLSLGVYIDINLNAISENKTEITVEVRRKIGTFNQAHEVTKANDHLVKIFDCIAKLTAMSNEQIEELKNQQFLGKSPAYKKAKTNHNSNEFGPNPNAWYEKTWLVVVLCIVFFPVGLYALWKNSSIAKGWKIATTVIIALILIDNLEDKTSTKSAATETQNALENEQTNSTETTIAAEKVDSEKELIIEKLKAKAKRDWPDDFTTQEFWVNQQIEDYEYMLSVEDNSIKAKAQKDWPLDFTTQKFWYNEQIEAQERMK